MLDSLQQEFQNQQPNVNAEELLQRLLRDILEIVFQLVQKSSTFRESFLNNGMLMIFIKFFEHEKLVEFLFKAYVNTLSKIMSIFFWLCRKLYYVNDKSEYITNETNVISVLIKERDAIEALSMQEESMKLQEKPIYRMYLICLGYLQEKLNVKFLSANHYTVIATRGFIPKTFKSVSDDFKSKIEYIIWEFMNENNNVEVKLVSKLKISGTANTAINTIIDALTCLRVIYTSDEAKQIAYDNYKDFIKSILCHGLEIEKVICLACMEKYCSLDSIKNEFFNDNNVKDCLIETYHMNTAENNVIKKRLNKKIFDIFDKYGFAYEISNLNNEF